MIYTFREEYYDWSVLFNDWRLIDLVDFNMPEYKWDAWKNDAVDNDFDIINYL